MVEEHKLFPSNQSQFFFLCIFRDFKYRYQYSLLKMMHESNTFLAHLYTMTVQDLMETINDQRYVVEKTDDITSVFSLLRHNDHVWVVERKDTMILAGVITQYDTVSLFSPPYTPLQSFEKPSLHSFQYDLPTTAEDVMSKKPIAADLNEKVLDVILKMKQHKVKQLPVIDSTTKLIGEVTLDRFISLYLEATSTSVTKEQKKRLPTSPK